MTKIDKRESEKVLIEVKELEQIIECLDSQSWDLNQKIFGQELLEKLVKRAKKEQNVQGYHT